MKKYFAYAVKAAAFLNSPQGKRDIALVVAGIGGALEIANKILG